MPGDAAAPDALTPQPPQPRPLTMSRNSPARGRTPPRGHPAAGERRGRVHPRPVPGL